MTLFEPAVAMFSPMTIKYLSLDWPGVFRPRRAGAAPDAGGCADRGRYDEQLYQERQNARLEPKPEN